MHALNLYRDGCALHQNLEIDFPRHLKMGEIDALLPLDHFEPKLKKLLSVGERVIVVWKGKCIEVGPQGKETLTPQDMQKYLP